MSDFIRRVVRFILYPYYRWQSYRLWKRWMKIGYPEGKTPMLLDGINDCIACWPLDDKPGGIARDISGNGNDGIYYDIHA